MIRVLHQAALSVVGSELSKGHRPGSILDVVAATSLRYHWYFLFCDPGCLMTTFMVKQRKKS